MPIDIEIIRAAAMVSIIIIAIVFIACIMLVSYKWYQVAEYVKTKVKEASEEADIVSNGDKQNQEKEGGD